MNVVIVGVVRRVSRPLFWVYGVSEYTSSVPLQMSMMAAIWPYVPYTPLGAQVEAFVFWLVAAVV